MKLASAIYGAAHPFDKFGLFSKVITARIPADLDGADALVVWGGADIHPSLYNDVNTHSGVGTAPSPRDNMEWELMKQAVHNKIPIIGICRGGQMLCALAGGKLYQHVDNHAGGGHGVVTRAEESFIVSSLHHQMMNPAGTKHELVAWSTHNRSPKYYDARGTHDKTSTEVEPEYIYFPEIRGHAIQWHPEFHRADEECNLWLKEHWRKHGL